MGNRLRTPQAAAGTPRPCERKESGRLSTPSPGLPRPSALGCNHLCAVLEEGGCKGLTRGRRDSGVTAAAAHTEQVPGDGCHSGVPAGDGSVPGGPSQAGQATSRHSRPAGAAVLRLCLVLPPRACLGHAPVACALVSQPGFCHVHPKDWHPRGPAERSPF